MASVFEADHDPRVQEGLAQIEAGIHKCMEAMYEVEDEHETGVMIQAWGLGVESLGYTQEGKRIRRFEALFPLGQSLSATRGALANADEGVIEAFFGDMDDNDD